MGEYNEIPTCPGCHFGCSLDAYRCGRGKGFAERRRAGESIPERGKPPVIRGGKGTPPVDARIMHGLNIMSNILQDRHTESAERKVLASVSRQGGFFAVGFLHKRTLVEHEQLNSAIDALVESGLADLADDPVAGRVLRITEAGRIRQEAWNSEQREAAAEFLSPLSGEEREQLADFLFRLISRSHGGPK